MTETVPAESSSSAAGLPARRAPRVVVAVGKASAWCGATLLWLPYRTRLIGFLSAARLLAFIPGAFGIHVRRSWYRRTLASCGKELVVEWMTVFKTPQTRVGHRVFIGSLCWVAEADIRDDVMVGSRTAIQGGRHTHSTERMDIPMRDQPETLATVTIGPDVWIGTGVTIMADVSRGTVVGAGAVVTSTFPIDSVIGGVPARLLRSRSTADAPSASTHDA